MPAAAARVRRPFRARWLPDVRPPRRQVPGCSFCTKSLCFEHIKEPIGSCDEVSATCVDYDTYWRLTVILLILLLLFSLLIIGCLRDVPVVSAHTRIYIIYAQGTFVTDQTQRHRIRERMREPARMRRRVCTRQCIATTPWWHTP